MKNLIVIRPREPPIFFNSPIGGGRGILYKIQYFSWKDIIRGRKSPGKTVKKGCCFVQKSLAIPAYILLEILNIVGGRFIQNCASF